MILSRLFKRKPEPVQEARPSNPLAIKFNPKCITRNVRREIKNIIRDEAAIPAHLKRRAYPILLDAIKAGFRLDKASQGLEMLGISKLEIRAIVTNVSRRCTLRMNLDREKNIGITHGIWRYSGSPCFLDARGGGLIKEGWEAASKGHERASGERFPLAEGLLIDGRMTWPGFDSGCKCVHGIVIE